MKTISYLYKGKDIEIECSYDLAIILMVRTLLTDTMNMSYLISVISNNSNYNQVECEFDIFHSDQLKHYLRNITKNFVPKRIYFKSDEHYDIAKQKYLDGLVNFYSYNNFLKYEEYFESYNFIYKDENVVLNSSELYKLADYIKEDRTIVERIEIKFKYKMKWKGVLDLFDAIVKMKFENPAMHDYKSVILHFNYRLAENYSYFSKFEHTGLLGNELESVPHEKTTLFIVQTILDIFSMLNLSFVVLGKLPLEDNEAAQGFKYEDYGDELKDIVKPFSDGIISIIK
jgi:hypothetical protein